MKASAGELMYFAKRQVDTQRTILFLDETE